MELDKFKTLIKKIDDQDEWKAKTRTPQNLPLDLSGEAILLVGTTKSGKSTFLNCLLQHPLTCTFDSADGEWRLENKNEGFGYPKIGAPGKSETLWPTLYKKHNIKVWDMPGLHDNRGPDMEIKQSSSTRMVINGHEAVSFILVVNYAELKNNNQMPLVEIINSLWRYSNNIAQHLFIVISKTEKNNWKIPFNKLLGWIPSKGNGNSEAINRAKSIVREVIKRDCGYSFKMPEYDDESQAHEYVFPDSDLLFKIDNINKIKIKNCPYVYSADSKKHLIKMSDKLMDAMSSEFSEICDYVVSESTHRIDDLLSFGNYEVKRQKLLSMISTVPDSLTYFKFLDYAKNNTSYCREMYYYTLINTLEEISLNLDKLHEVKDYQFANKINKTFTDIKNHLQNKYSEIYAAEQERQERENSCNIL